MGMAPTPEQLEKMRALNEGEEPRRKPMIEGEIPVLSPLFKSEISQLIYSIGWTYQKKVLDHAEVLCNNDRTWEIVRRVIMSLQHEQIEVTQRVVGQKVRELQMKAKEITDDESTNGTYPGIPR